MSDYVDIDTARTTTVNVTLDQGSSFVNPTPGRALPAATVMDPGGNVVLVVPSDQGKTNFLVNSSMICIASPVIRTMLHSNTRFREASALHAFSGGTPFEITLKDDNPKALAVLLRIIHMKYNLVPQSLDEDQLYEVAVVCDKYDMQQAIWFWIQKWVPLLVPDESKPTGTVKGHKWLFISYAFAREKLFKALTKPLILSSPIDSSGKLQMRAADGSCCNDYIPVPLYKNIEDRRHATLWAMLLEVKKLIGEYQNDGQLKCTQQKEACDSYLLGLLTRAFQRKNAYPLSKTLPVMSKSIEELKKILSDITLPEDMYLVQLPTFYCNNYECHRREIGLNGHCDYCGRSRGPMPQISNNHVPFCSPLENFKKDIQAIYDKVEGLNPADFIRWRNEGPEKELVKPRAGQTLWDFIEYE